VIETLVPLGLLGAMLGLDTVSFPQAMLSRPLVAATCGGALLGSPSDGLIMGATLELIALVTLPFGASRYPEWGSASAVGGALFAEASDHSAGAMTIALVAALTTAWVGSWSMVKLRQWNATWAAGSRGGLDAGARGSVIGLQLKGMTADLARGLLVTVVAWAVFAPLARLALAEWTMDPRISRAIAVGVATSVAAGAAWKLFHGSIAARWTFVLGLAAGFGMMVMQ
jgi:mannose/fructose/N-acetylgalactosamine-specific phosphotransferase system component IIC